MEQFFLFGRIFYNGLPKKGNKLSLEFLKFVQIRIVLCNWLPCKKRIYQSNTYDILNIMSKKYFLHYFLYKIDSGVLKL